MAGRAFTPLIAEKLALLEKDLAHACESLASDREAQLRDENQRLLAENAVLRRQLELQKAGDVSSLRDASSSHVDKIVDTTEFETAIDVALSSNNQAPCSSTPSDIAKSKRMPSSETLQSRPYREPNGGNFELLPELSIVTFAREETFLDEVGQEKAEVAEEGFVGLLHHLEEELVKIVKTGRCPVMDPASAHRLAWEILGIPILAWDLITIPLQAFDPSLPEVAQLITLIYWTIDIPFTFITGIYDKNCHVVYDHKAIAKHYMRGFFLLDFAMITSDWTHVFIGLLSDGERPGFLRNVALLRILRISRFARLLRLRTLKEKLHALEDSLQSEWYLHILDMVLKVLNILAINHYIGCLWYALGEASGLAEDRWLTTYRSGGELLTDSSFWYKYTTCLHWAISQFTPGGSKIAPANPYERVFNILVLMFGLVIFSSFVASVTQARMTMARMIGKFERQHWMLREYCRQHHISSSLQTDMKRYIDVVVAPTHWKLKLKEVELVSMLSPNLRQRLNCEIYSDQIVCHPFLGHVRERHHSLMSTLCTSVIEPLPLAKKDVAFSGGHKAQFMFVVGSGLCDYILVKDPTTREPVSKGQWANEAVFWTVWIHQGQLQATRDTQTMIIDGAKFRAAVTRSAVCMRLVRNYGTEFCQSLNDLVRRKVTLTDLHDFASTYFVPGRKFSSTFSLNSNEEEVFMTSV